jgi:hypothetical protein
VAASSEGKETAMKAIAFTLIALTVVIGLVVPPSAFDAKRFWHQHDLTPASS